MGKLLLKIYFGIYDYLHNLNLWKRVIFFEKLGNANNISVNER